MSTTEEGRREDRGEDQRETEDIGGMKYELVKGAGYVMTET